MSTILDEHTSEVPSSPLEYTTFTKRVMGTFIELINIWGLQVILYSYVGFSRFTSELYALSIIWFIKVFTEKYGKPAIGRVATGALVINDSGQIPTWKEVLFRNIVWTTILVVFWCTYVTQILYPNFPIESSDIWSWITMYVSERLLLYVGVLIFLADRTAILVHPKNKSLQDLLGHTVVIQKD